MYPCEKSHANPNENQQILRQKLGKAGQVQYTLPNGPLLLFLQRKGKTVQVRKGVSGSFARVYCT